MATPIPGKCGPARQQGKYLTKKDIMKMHIICVICLGPGNKGPMATPISGKGSPPRQQGKYPAMLPTQNGCIQCSGEDCAMCMYYVCGPWALPSQEKVALCVSEENTRI